MPVAEVGRRAGRVSATFGSWCWRGRESIGIRESARFNATIVVIKVSVVLFVIGLGAMYISRGNWGNSWSSFAPFGFTGIGAGAAYIFFAYIGFDAVSTTAQEAKNPQRDLPIGIIASLLVCTVLYILVAGVLTGMVPWREINIEAPIARAFLDRGLAHYGPEAGEARDLLRRSVAAVLDQLASGSAAASSDLNPAATGPEGRSREAA